MTTSIHACWHNFECTPYSSDGADPGEPGTLKVGHTKFSEYAGVSGNQLHFDAKEYHESNNPDSIVMVVESHNMRVEVRTVEDGGEHKVLAESPADRADTLLIRVKDIDGKPFIVEDFGLIQIQVETNHGVKHAGTKRSNGIQVATRRPNW